MLRLRADVIPSTLSTVRSPSRNGLKRILLSILFSRPMTKG